MSVLVEVEEAVADTVLVVAVLVGNVAAVGGLMES